MSAYYFRLAWHGLRKAPWLSSLMVLTLAVGIASSVTTNALRYMLARNPMPDKAALLLSVQDPSMPTHMGNLLSFPVVQQLGKLGKDLGRYAYTGLGIDVEAMRPDSPLKHVKVGIRYTTRTFFAMFDVPVHAGRVWTQAEQTEHAPVAVLARSLAEQLFPGEDALGETVLIGHRAYTVIGIAADWDPKPRFYNLQHPAGPFGGGGFGISVPVTTIDLAPSTMKYQISCPNGEFGMPEPKDIIKRGCSWFSAWYLANSPQDALRLRRLLEARLPEIMPARQARKIAILDVSQIIDMADLVPGSVRVYALLGLAFLTLCVVNAGGMQISRVLRSREQIGIRRAMGASRWEIVKQFLFDALLIGSVGGFLGMALTFVSFLMVRKFLDTGYANMAQMNVVVFMAMIALVLVCSLLVGVVPAWLASLENPAKTIKSAQ
ncbi:MAG TPA: ABC transporter permease [Rhodanobacteraceae bacterium]|nr:ABC transporter permease [Rhodanobacteraceae bacterium]